MRLFNLLLPIVVIIKMVMMFLFSLELGWARDGVAERGGVLLVADGGRLHATRWLVNLFIEVVYTTDIWLLHHAIIKLFYVVF